MVNEETNIFINPDEKYIEAVGDPTEIFHKIIEIFYEPEFFDYEIPVMAKPTQAVLRSMNDWRVVVNKWEIKNTDADRSFYVTVD